MGSDPTTRYFEAHSRDYHPRRLATAVGWVGELAAPADRLFDVGCGTGQILEVMREAGIEHLAGCDTADAALQAATQRVVFAPYRGSILDEEFVGGFGTYRFVTVAAVLHHVVGKRRRASREMAVAAIRNSLRLVAPGVEIHS